MNRKLLFLGCNTIQLPYLEVIKKQNWFVVGIDMNPIAPGKNLCNKFYNLGYDNLPELIEIGKMENFGNNDMVFTAASQFAHKGAAHFAKFFDIPYPSEDSIDTCLNKHLYYQLFVKSGIPIPRTWYLENETQLKNIINRLESKKNMYLKSDFSKNPKYIYKFNSNDVPYEKICWEYDRYFRKYYILQEEFFGDHLRINIYGSRYNVFEFFTNKHTKKYHERLEYFKVIKKLKKLMDSFKLGHWLIKFDVILGIDQFVVLDIGMEPPFRMKLFSIEHNIPFEEYYVEQYLQGIVNYPSLID